MRTTGLARRLAAILYDAILLFAVLALTTIGFVAVRHGEAVEPHTLTYQLTLLIMSFAYFTGYWMWRGRTLGMQSWGLQLESIDGSAPTFRQCSLRYLAALLSWAAVGLGFIWQLWDPERRTWHDRLSGTRLMHYPRKKK